MAGIDAVFNESSDAVVHLLPHCRKKNFLLSGFARRLGLGFMCGVYEFFVVKDDEGFTVNICFLVLPVAYVIGFMKFRSCEKRRGVYMTKRRRFR